jgi:hypothetical protein
VIETQVVLNKLCKKCICFINWNVRLIGPSISYRQHHGIMELVSIDIKIVPFLASRWPRNMYGLLHLKSG